MLDHTSYLSLFCELKTTRDVKKRSMPVPELDWSHKHNCFVTLVSYEMQNPHHFDSSSYCFNNLIDRLWRSEAIMKYIHLPIKLVYLLSWNMIVTRYYAMSNSMNFIIASGFSQWDSSSKWRLMIKETANQRVPQLRV